MKDFITRLIAYIFNLGKRCSMLNTYESYRQKYNIHSSFIFNGEGILMYGDGEIHIGEDSYIGRHSLLQVASGYEIHVGMGCKIGPFFQIWTQSSNADDDYSLEIRPKLGNVVIGDYVWIGSGVLIAPGVKIGSNSIIGTNSVVTKDVPEYAIVGGIPARLIRFKKCLNISL